MEDLILSNDETDTETANESACPDAPCSAFLRLEYSDSIVDMDGIRSIRSIDKKGDRWLVWRKIRLQYKSGEVVEIPYGADDKYHHETAKRDQRDSDFAMIEKQIFP